MSIKSQIQTLRERRGAIVDALKEKGVDLADNASLKEIADAIPDIKGGGMSPFVLEVVRTARMTDETFSELELKSIDVSTVRDFSYLFFGSPLIKSIDITAWDMRSATSVAGMFLCCTQLTSLIGDKTMEDVDGGLVCMKNLHCSVDLEKTPLNLATVCAVLQGLGTASEGAVVNLSTKQHEEVTAHTAVDYIGKAKAKGWKIFIGGYSEDNSADEQAGAIIGKDSGGNTRVVKYADFIKDDFDVSTFTPIAVLVIPRSHMADGKCRGMSLVHMSCNTPEAGTTANGTMMWGEYGADIAELPNYGSCTTGNVEQGGTLGTSVYPYIPTDMIVSDIPSKVDVVDGIPQSYYGTGTPLAPSPYAENNTANPQYHRGLETSKNLQANTDMDGMGNTEILIQRVAKSEQGGVLELNSGAITNSQPNYPAAVTCYRYRGGGTGGWYLPSLGEGGYLCARWGRIDVSLKAIREKYGTSAAALINSTTRHWCSTEFSSNYARVVVPSTGLLDYIDKGVRSAVRAFHAF